MASRQHHASLDACDTPLGFSTFLARGALYMNACFRPARLSVVVFTAALILTPLRFAVAQVLRPGDALRIDVWRHPELSGELVVAPDSTLVHPVYQVVKVAGVPMSVVVERLRGLLSTYEEGVPFDLEPLFPVTVAGEVRQPNLYRLRQGMTFAQAIAMAGGPTEMGRLDKVHVIRRDGSMVINLARGYARYAAMPVASGDQILVARRASFNVVRDVLYPVASLSAAVAAIIAYTRKPS